MLFSFVIYYGRGDHIPGDIPLHYILHSLHSTRIELAFQANCGRFLRFDFYLIGKFGDVLLEAPPCNSPGTHVVWPVGDSFKNCTGTSGGLISHGGGSPPARFSLVRGTIFTGLRQRLFGGTR